MYTGDRTLQEAAVSDSPLKTRSSVICRYVSALPIEHPLTVSLPSPPTNGSLVLTTGNILKNCLMTQSSSLSAESVNQDIKELNSEEVQAYTHVMRSIDFYSAQLLFLEILFETEKRFC